MADKFEGDKRWTIGELVKMPHGLDSMYRELFARVLGSKQDDFTYNVDKVSEQCGIEMR